MTTSRAAGREFHGGAMCHGSHGPDPHVASHGMCRWAVDHNLHSWSGSFSLHQPTLYMDLSMILPNSTRFDPFVVSFPSVFGHLATDRGGTIHVFQCRQSTFQTMFLTRYLTLEIQRGALLLPRRFLALEGCTSSSSPVTGTSTNK